MNKIALPSRHMIQNLSPGGLRPRTLPLGHRGSPQYWIFTSERGRNIFVSLKLEGQSGVRTSDLRLSKQAALTTAPGSPPYRDIKQTISKFRFHWHGPYKRRLNTIEKKEHRTFFWIIQNERMKEWMTAWRWSIQQLDTIKTLSRIDS